MIVPTGGEVRGILRQCKDFGSRKVDYVLAV